MAISGVNPKCYILALFVRDDGARFLLGDDPFEFKDNQLHFQQNTMANDVVEVQGNDGYLLAGQVRRPGTQMFDGYVCNGTNSKAEVEVKRREFLQFFRRSHFYKVIYVFPNGTAIQRKQGFLVDDPTVQELYQQYPEYHVALNFEDVNYYTYEEDDQGQEIYAKEAIVPLAGGGATGGLIWDEYGVVWEDPWSLPLSISGVQFQILNNAGARAPIDNVKLYGDTYQQTYSGKNLLPSNPVGTTTVHNVTITVDETGRITVNGTADANVYFNLNKVTLAAGSYMLSGVPFNGNSSSFRIAFKFGGTIQSLFSVNGKTFTLDNTYTATEAFLFIAKDYTANNLVFEPMIESGSSKTSYEPYVGGIPAPNPDYPQEIHTVSGEQTVEVHGKNLLDSLHGFANKYINDSGVEASGGGNNALFGYIAVKPETAYALSQKSDSLRLRNYGFAYYDANKTFLSRATYNLQAAQTITTPSNCSFIRIWVANSQTGVSQAIIEQSQLQFEQGSATAYEPYQSQTYTIDLDDIELCKIGDYRDKIFNNDPNEDWYDPDLEDNAWYVHKACDSSLLGGFTWTAQNTYNSTTIKKMSTDGLSGVYLPPTNSSTTILAYCTHYQTETEASVNLRNIGVSGRTNGNDIFIYDPDYNTSSSPSNFKTWLSNNSVALYYVLATPTDTKITDATLVGQLEALGAMKLFIGENNVLVSAPTPNLPATLAFDYYSKFATIGAEWEEGGTKGATIVNVDAIDNTYPVWELTGPATNPTLSVLTTNTALTYNGTITASQKLVIDMFNKTATLNGTSVIGNISGDFVYMAPGTNRLAYTAGNTDAPDSTIYWQEVVG